GLAVQIERGLRIGGAVSAESAFPETGEEQDGGSVARVGGGLPPLGGFFVVGLLSEQSPQPGFAEDAACVRGVALGGGFQGLPAVRAFFSVLGVQQDERAAVERFLVSGGGRFLVVFQCVGPRGGDALAGFRGETEEEERIGVALFGDGSREIDSGGVPAFAES